MYIGVNATSALRAAGVRQRRFYNSAYVNYLIYVSIIYTYIYYLYMFGCIFSYACAVV